MVDTLRDERADSGACAPGWPGMVAAVFVVSVFWSVFISQSGGRWDVELWNSWGVPAWVSPFFDMQHAAIAWEMTREGVDVRRTVIPGYDQPLMWPTAWLAFTPLGVTRASLPAFSIAVALIFYVSVFVFLAAGSWGRGLMVGVGAVSPPVLLCLERMNGDLIVFILLLAAMVLNGRKAWAAQAAGYGLASFAAMLKLFPVVAIPVLVGRLRRPAVLLALLALLGFAAYVFWDYREIARIGRDAPQMSAYSYGAKAVAEQIVLVAGKAGMSLTANVAWMLTCLVVVAGSVLLAGYFVFFSARRGVWDAALERNSFDLQAFAVGAVIFVSTFVLLKNFDYRLVFLLLCLSAAFASVPFLLRATAWLSLVYLWLAPGWVWWASYVKSGMGVLLAVLLGAALLTAKWHDWLPTHAERSN